MSQQIQADLFGISSYQCIRKPAKGQCSSASQMALFPVKAMKAAMVKLKKGQRYIVEKTKLVVTFVRRRGNTTVWAFEGHLFSVSDNFLINANLQAMTANTE